MPCSGPKRRRSNDRGAHWFTGGVIASPPPEIESQFDFMFEGVRYVPPCGARPPKLICVAPVNASPKSNANSRPHILLRGRISGLSLPARRLHGAATVRSCGAVFDEFLASARQSANTSGCTPRETRSARSSFARRSASDNV